MQRSFVQMWAQMMMSNLQDPFLGEIKVTLPTSIVRNS